MSNLDLTVIDYGIGNLHNVVRALQHCGANVTLIDNASQIKTLPERLVLPGVGAFAGGMREIQHRGFDDLIKRYVSTQRPFLGICVGAQMLFDVGEEFGNHAGLGLIPGRVKAVPAFSANGESHRVPHIGWSCLEASKPEQTWRGTIFDKVNLGAAVYFVHSFAVYPDNQEDQLAITYYDGIPICAAVRRNNIYGCQFHPERSADVGLQILKSFMLM